MIDRLERVEAPAVHHRAAPAAPAEERAFGGAGAAHRHRRHGGARAGGVERDGRRGARRAPREQVASPRARQERDRQHAPRARRRRRALRAGRAADGRDGSHGPEEARALIADGAAQSVAGERDNRAARRRERRERRGMTRDAVGAVRDRSAAGDENRPRVVVVVRRSCRRRTRAGRGRVVVGPEFGTRVRRDVSERLGTRTRDTKPGKPETGGDARAPVVARHRVDARREKVGRLDACQRGADHVHERCGTNDVSGSRSRQRRARRAEDDRQNAVIAAKARARRERDAAAERGGLGGVRGEDARGRRDEQLERPEGGAWKKALGSVTVTVVVRSPRDPHGAEPGSCQSAGTENARNAEIRVASALGADADETRGGRRRDAVVAIRARARGGAQEVRARAEDAHVRGRVRRHRGGEAEGARRPSGAVCRVAADVRHAGGVAGKSARVRPRERGARARAGHRHGH